MNLRRKLRPALSGEFWMIGPNPDLGPLNGWREGLRVQECVDHHIYSSRDGKWHLWGCIRKTAVGRVLYHWETDDLTNERWKQTGEVLRVSRDAGESLNDWFAEEWIQSPFVVEHADNYYMFFGGHGTGVDAAGRPTSPDSRLMQSQICLMTSTDGRNWRRHRNEQEQSRLFVGPGETRDPCVIRIDGLWHLYYAGYEMMDGAEIPGIYVRTSKDLVHWSEYQVVHVDRDPAYGSGNWNTECPFVIEKEGYFYLFRTENYAAARTHVFRSEDPLDFGAGTTRGQLSGAARDKYVGLIPVAAPEVIAHPDGTEYITSNHNLTGGTMMSKLMWIEE